MSPDIPWPMLGQAPLIRAWAEKVDDNRLLKHFEQVRPMSFVAQFDLPELAKLGAIAADLPKTGRLLVFCDMVAVAYGPDWELCKVIWDQGANPEEGDEPEGLEALEEASKAEASGVDHIGFLKDIGASEEEIAKFKAEMEAYDQMFRNPKTGLVFNLVDRLPHSASMAFKNGPDEVKKALRKTAARDAYEEILGWTPPAQLLGPTSPVQDDPAFDAARVAATGKLFAGRSARERTLTKEEAPNWRLLLQLPMTTWLQTERAEGVIYLMIRDDDLKEDKFERVLAVYQQT